MHALVAYLLWVLSAGLVALAGRRAAGPQEGDRHGHRPRDLAGPAYGTVLLLMVAAGLACFGAYCLFDARYRRG